MTASLVLVSDPDYWKRRLRQWLLGKAETTQETYANDLKDFARWRGVETFQEAFSELFAGELEIVGAMVQVIALDYYEDLKTRPIWRSPKAKARGDDPIQHGLSPASISRRLAAFRAVVHLAEEARMCPRGISLPTSPKVRTLRDTRGIERRDFLQILDTLDHAIDTAKRGSQQHALAVRDYAIVLLLHDIGLRRAEVHGIQIESIVRDTRGMSIWICRKGDSLDEPQSWSIASNPARAINAWLELRGNPLHGPVFTSRKGKPFKSLDTLNRIVERWGLRSDVEDLHPHKLRHTAITTLRRKGVDILGMQGFAGHKDPKVTMVYIHNEGDEVRAAQELLGGNEDDDGTDPA